MVMDSIREIQVSFLITLLFREVPMVLPGAIFTVVLLPSREIIDIIVVQVITGMFGSTQLLAILTDQLQNSTFMAPYRPVPTQPAVVQ